MKKKESLGIDYNENDILGRVVEWFPYRNFIVRKTEQRSLNGNE